MALQIRTLVAALALTLVAPDSATAAPAKAKEAMGVFKTKHGQVMRLVRGKASAKKIQKQVDGLLDYAWISQTALGGPNRSKRRCEPRCDEFEALLTRLIRENYLKRIRMSQKGSVEYVGEEKRPRASKITTRVQYTKNGRKQQLEVAYVMHMVEGTWQVRDIITDGVSLARNYKYEFNKILRDKGIDELVLRLENKLAELARNK